MGCRQGMVLSNDFWNSTGNCGDCHFKIAEEYKEEINSTGEIDVVF
jgi:hypothetical protein